eukprot:NODE_8103_length_424_cov_54.413333_g7239_i0.p5 GENE.NODE_8103_length_424_cov_54.413333_g7239_i0~~NODE_8103_length_424_cov_54.413333_g7239_i0.p5  ORF type:complete len:52 (-),score=26.63 NODE_8103_length_424_cov_54.413333_g7239_i0:268-399(-)
MGGFPEDQVLMHLWGLRALIASILEGKTPLTLDLDDTTGNATD